MLALDTSAWIEWLLGSAIGKAVDALLLPQPELLVPTIVQFELAKWARREHNDDNANGLIAYTSECAVVPIDTGIALAGASFARQHKLAIADALIYASAQAYDAELITCDHHFDGLPGVRYLPKLNP